MLAVCDVVKHVLAAAMPLIRVGSSSERNVAVRVILLDQHALPLLAVVDRVAMGSDIDPAPAIVPGVMLRPALDVHAFVGGGRVAVAGLGSLSVVRQPVGCRVVFVFGLCSWVDRLALVVRGLRQSSDRLLA